MEKYNIWRSGYLSKFHEVLPLPRKVTLQLHEILRLPRKMNLTWLIRIRYETSFTMRGATGIILQLHQILRLPRNSEFKMSAENPWIASANIKTIRAWSEDNPKIKSSSRTRRFGDLTRPILETYFVWKNTTFGARAIYPNFTKCCPCHENSPNTAPATQNESHSWLIRIRYETSFTMRGATGIILQLHQILRLPRNSEFKMSAEDPWIASVNIKTIRAWSEDNPKIKSSSRTRRFGDLTRPILETYFVWKNTTFGARAIYPNFTKCCPCHEKWHSNFTKNCACHEKCTLLFCRHLFSLGIYSLGIYSLLASTL